MVLQMYGAVQATVAGDTVILAKSPMRLFLASVGIWRFRSAESDLHHTLLPKLHPFNMDSLALILCAS